MKELENVITIPGSWGLIFKLKNDNNWKYLDCKEILSFPYAKELIPDENSFQNVKKHKTKVSWNNEQMEICLDRLLEEGINLNLK